MEELIRVSAISYANSIPFVQGLLQSDIIHDINLSLDIPSVCASKLMNDKADIGLIPIAIIPELEHSRIISDYCISAENNARTVALISNVPLNKIKTVYLDNDSRTSIILAQVLASRFWNIDVEWKKADNTFHSSLVKNDTAAVVIGDKVFQVEDKFPYQYDLAEEWKRYTGLPFVFACWVANKELDISFLSRFNKSLSDGISDITSSIASDNRKNTYRLDLKKYLTETISFMLDEPRKKAMDLFLYYKEECVKNGFIVI